MKKNLRITELEMKVKELEDVP
ncbi:hypothetical protein LCGC14_2603590, partial [marine sediment metagenome]